MPTNATKARAPVPAMALRKDAILLKMENGIFIDLAPKHRQRTSGRRFADTEPSDRRIRPEYIAPAEHQSPLWRSKRGGGYNPEQRKNDQGQKPAHQSWAPPILTTRSEVEPG